MTNRGRRGQPRHAPAPCRRPGDPAPALMRERCRQRDAGAQDSPIICEMRESRAGTSGHRNLIIGSISSIFEPRSEPSAGGAPARFGHARNPADLPRLRPAPFTTARIRATHGIDLREGENMNRDECGSRLRTDREISGRVPVTGKVLAGTGLLLAAGSAGAEVPGESQFVFNTFSFLIWGALVMWMCAGFTMLESGSGAHQERLGDLPQEHRALLHRGARLLLPRLQPDVHRRDGMDRLVPVPVRPVGGRARPPRRPGRGEGALWWRVATR